MKLYLSSYRLGPTPERLATLAGANKRVAIISNAFILCKAMRQRGFDTWLQQVRSQETRRAFVYAGFSAGAVVAACSLRDLDLMDQTDIVPEPSTRAPVCASRGH